MRKRSEEEEARLLYRSKKEMRRRNKKKRHVGKPHSAHTPLPSSHNSDWNIIRSPAHLDFNEHYQTSAEFIDRIRRIAVKKKQSLFIDMSSCLELAPDTALVLAAEIQRARALNDDCINGRNPIRKRPLRLLRNLGFHELLGFQYKEIQDQPESDVEYIHMRSGSAGDTSLFPKIMEKVFGKSAELSGVPAYNSISRALSEALHNAVQHAYEDMDEILYKPADDYRWWIAGYRDPKTRAVAFMFYDQGMTIPASLPKKWGETAKSISQKLASAVGLSESSSTDGAMLAAAMEIGRSSTKRDGRGWGLSEMRALVGGPLTENESVKGIMGSGEGSLKILSRQGSYIYTNAVGDSYPTLPVTFHGTLVVWTLLGSDAVIWRNDNE